MTKIKAFFSRYILTRVKPSFVTAHIGSKPVRIIITVFAYVCAAVFPLWCYLASEYVHFSTIAAGKFVSFLQNRTSVAVGMVLMLYGFWLLLNLLLKKAWAANLALGGTVVVFAVVNHFKYVLTGEFLLPLGYGAGRQYRRAERLRVGRLSAKICAFLTQHPAAGPAAPARQCHAASAGVCPACRRLYSSGFACFSA